MEERKKITVGDMRRMQGDIEENQQSSEESIRRAKERNARWLAQKGCVGTQPEIEPEPEPSIEKTLEERKLARRKHEKRLVLVTPSPSPAPELEPEAVTAIDKPWKTLVPFIQLGRVLLADKQLTSGAIHLANIISTFDMKDKKNKKAGKIWAGEERLALAIGKSRSRVSKYFKNLQDAGWIKRGGRGNKSSVTVMTVPVFSTIAEIEKRFRLTGVPLNADDFKIMLPEHLHKELELLFNDKNKNKPTIVPEENPEIEGLAGYLRSFYEEKAFSGIKGHITDEDMAKFRDGARKCVKFLNDNSSNFAPYVRYDAQDVAKELCKSIEEFVDKQFSQSWRTIHPGHFNSDKSFKRLLKYMNDQALLRTSNNTYDSTVITHWDDDDQDQFDEDE
jgi:hypothetical protein